jgi:hypothetical protein
MSRFVHGTIFVIMDRPRLHAPYEIASDRAKKEKVRGNIERVRAQFKEGWGNLIEGLVDGPARNTKRLADGHTQSVKELGESLNLLDIDDELAAKIESIFEVVARVSDESKKAFGEKKWQTMIVELEALRNDARHMAFELRKKAAAAHDRTAMFGKVIEELRRAA